MNQKKYIFTLYSLLIIIFISFSSSSYALHLTEDSPLQRENAMSPDELEQEKDISESFRPLTKKFMNEVEKNAPYWFNKLQNKTNMIELKDVEKIVAYRNYDKGQVLYINGYLQSMAL